MAKYIIKRLFVSILTFWLMATLTFYIMNLVPGNPFIGEPAPSAAALENLEEKYHLNEPLIVQYAYYMQGLLHGDMGTSLVKNGREVSEIIATAFPISLVLGLSALCIAVPIGLILGVITSIYRNTYIDKTILIIATIGVALPSFVLAPILIMIFCINLEWFPVVTGNFLDSESLGEMVNRMFLPVICLSFGTLSYILRLLRSSMLDVISQDYIRTARAKGLSERKVILKHGLRNGILPVITIMGPVIAGLITGTFVIEQIFTIPGLGSYFVDSVTNRDYPVIMGTTIFYGGLIILLNFVVDIIYGFVDPRIKIQT